MLFNFLANNRNRNSLASRMRRRRFRLFLDMLEALQAQALPGPLQILDIGGRQAFWEDMLDGGELAPGVHITLLNVEPLEVTRPEMTALNGDGRAMPQFADGQFEIVFSNSTIEHVGGLADQQAMADEIRRVGRQYFIQTPNRGFPIEPHFVFPFFQFLPVNWRVWLLQRFNLGWYGPIRDAQAARELVTSIRLLTRAEFKSLFPGGCLYEEKTLGLVKSFIMYTPPAGWTPSRNA